MKVGDKKNEYIKERLLGNRIGKRASMPCQSQRLLVSGPQ